MHAEVQRYYGEVLSSTEDLKTSACCTIASQPAYLTDALSLIHDEVTSRYYGCGLVLPEALDGASVLDLGCGAGRDVYVLSRLVGEQGRVVGVDMTPEQLAVARRHRDFHAQQFGHEKSNVEFVDGNIERLGETDLAEAQFDIIVSNCVINLATDKQAVLDEAFRLLKPGGELYFADVYADRRVPAHLQADPVLYGECLSGALYWRDFMATAKLAGFADPRLVTDRPLTVEDKALAEKLGDIRFFSVTYRLFKLSGLEATSEDYGQTARYLGNDPWLPDAFSFDKSNLFKTGEPQPVDGNTARMLESSRLATHFEVTGERNEHLGSFERDTHDSGLPFDIDAETAGNTGSCC